MHHGTKNNHAGRSTYATFASCPLRGQLVGAAGTARGTRIIDRDFGSSVAAAQARVFRLRVAGEPAGCGGLAMVQTTPQALLALSHRSEPFFGSELAAWRSRQKAPASKCDVRWVVHPHHRRIQGETH